MKIPFKTNNRTKRKKLNEIVQNGKIYKKEREKYQKELEEKDFNYKFY